MPLSQNELSVLALVASDIAYRPLEHFRLDPPGLNIPLSSYQDSALGSEFGFATPLLSGFSNDPSSFTAFKVDHDPTTGAVTVTFPNWEFVIKVEEPRNGFGAVVFRSKTLIDGHRHYIVALQGSDGLNSQDWFQNLDLARAAWNFSGAALIDQLTSLPENDVIHFTGQSLGGGLAQYAAYSYVQRRRASNPEWVARGNVSLVTFNGFAAVDGIRTSPDPDDPPFDPYLLAGVQTYHYGIENDIVYRLGKGDGPAPGGSWHLNGLGNSYLLDFRRFLGGNEVVGKQNYLSLVDAHRIEAGFYQGFDNYEKTFESVFRHFVAGRPIGRPVLFSYIDTGITQGISARIAHAFTKGGVATESEALARLAAGVLAGTTVGPIQEIQALTDVIVDALHKSGHLTDAGRASLKVAPFGMKALVTGLAKASLGPAGALLLAFGTSFLKVFSSAEQRDAIREFNRQLVPTEQLAEVTFAVPGDTQFDAALRFRLAIHQVGSYLDSTDIVLLYPNQAIRETSNIIQSIAPDSEEFFRTLVDGPNWLRKSLR